MKDSNCGTALWLIAREKKAIEIPVSDLISKQFPIINPSMVVENTMLVNALKIGFGNGQIERHKEAFGYMNDWLGGAVASLNI